MKVVGLQIWNEWDVLKNLDAATDAICNLEEKVDLIVLPELFTIGPMGTSHPTFPYLNEIAEDENGFSFLLFKQLARQNETYISFGFPEKTDGQGYYISQAVINPQGEVEGIYRKMNLTREELEFFSRGNQLFSFCVKGIKVGISTCYDIRFPEHARRLTMEHGIHLMIHPSIFHELDGTWESWHSFVQTRAVENQIYVLSINQGGHSRGNSIMASPHPGVKPTLSIGGIQGQLYEDISLKSLEGIRRRYPLLEDRKLEF